MQFYTDDLIVKDGIKRENLISTENGEKYQMTFIMTNSVYLNFEIY